MQEALITSYMFREAAEGPQVVLRQSQSPQAREAAAAIARLAPPLLLTCARGSSDQAATYLQYLAPMRLGIPCYSHPPSLGSVLDATSSRLAGAAMILISQSGQSPDLLRSAEAARKAGIRLFGLINDTTSPLAAMVDHLVPLHAGHERSVAATKSYIATLAAMLRIVAHASDDSGLLGALDMLPDKLERAWETDWQAAIEPLESAESLFVLGRDLTLGIAGEAALKFKEVAGIHAEVLSLAEVAHGPMALIASGTPVLAFPSDASLASTGPDLLRDFVRRGARVMTVGSENTGAIILRVESALPEVRPLLAIQSFYRLAEGLSKARGHDPDNPPSLKKATHTL